MQPILFIESNPDQLRSLQNLLQKNGVANPWHAVADASQALSYLKGEGVFSDRSCYPLPSVIFLDIHLGGFIGFKLLQWIKRQPELASSFIVICSELTSIADLRRCYQYGAQTFLLKPFNNKELQNLLRHFPHFWKIGKTTTDNTTSKVAARPGPSGEPRYTPYEVIHHGEEMKV